MNRITEIRWHGRGGQGAKTASLLLAGAALKEGKYVQAFPEYGPERMGAPMQSFTRISEIPIKLHSHITNPEAVVVLDSTLLDTVDITEGLPEGGIIVVNTSKTPLEVKEKLNFNKGKIFTVDATSISLNAFGRNLPNTPMLGALIKVTNLLKIETVIFSIKEKMGKKFASKIVEGNVQALKKAYEEVKEE